MKTLHSALLTRSDRLRCCCLGGMAPPAASAAADPPVPPPGDPPVLPPGSKAWYTMADGQRVLTTILKVHYDDPPPYYTISIEGRERSTVRSKLEPTAPAAGAEGAAGGCPPTQQQQQMHGYESGPEGSEAAWCA